MRTCFRVLTLTVVILSSFIFSLNKVNLPAVNQNYDQNFSALNVSNDIEVISKEPHSIKHPEERAKVRDYLYDRLTSLGVDTRYLRYDSVKDRFGDYIDIANLYGVIEPSDEKRATSYVLLMAHLDSRYKMKRGEEWVCSYGAADDGYGLGVIIELIRIINYYRDNWSQGVKILFTDSEESDLEGIKNSIQKDNHLFDNVGLIVNIEARGIKGPVVMFETTSGNSKLSKLYSKGKYLCSYSFTNAIYKILPNYTDFSYIKDKYPGLNFAVIDNLNYYHTELDNFSNISLVSIQHYGEQISPIIKEYLTNQKYSDPEYLFDDSDNLFFSIPLVGFFVITPGLHLLLFLLFVSVFITISYFTFLNNKNSLFNSLKSLSVIILSSVSLAAVSFLISLLLAHLNDIKFYFTYLPFVNNEYTILIFFLCLFIFVNLLIYSCLIKKMKIKHIEIQISAIFLIIILSLILQLFINDSILFSLVMMLSVLSYIVGNHVFLRNFLFIPLFLISIFSIQIIYLLYVALTIGSLSILILILSLILWQILPIAGVYLKRDI